MTSFFFVLGVIWSTILVGGLVAIGLHELWDWVLVRRELRRDRRFHAGLHRQWNEIQELEALWMMNPSSPGIYHRRKQHGV